MGKPIQGMQDIQPRYIEIWDIKFPQSTNNKMIIEPNGEGLGFRLDCYNEKLINVN